MEQRRLRLGDILDDYCPRERRVTNHAVVAMIEEDVKQTRCTTCDAEHAYKGARVPARRKKETPAALYKEVLAGMPETDEAPPLATPAAPVLASAPPAVPAAPAPIASVSVEEVKPGIEAGRAEVRDVTESAIPGEEARADTDFDGNEPPTVDGPVHRQLIRATLPRVEGQKDARPAPDFTMRHTPSRGGGNGHGSFRGDRDRLRVRGGNGNGNGNSYGHANGNRSSSGPRFQGNRGPGGGRQPMGRAGGPPSGFRGNGNGGNGNKRGRGSRG